MFVFRNQNVEQNRNSKIANRYFEKVAKFKYLETTVSNKNHIYKTN